jgi:hypothetical protein
MRTARSRSGAWRHRWHRVHHSIPGLTPLPSGRWDSIGCSRTAIIRKSADKSLPIWWQEREQQLVVSLMYDLAEDLHRTKVPPTRPHFHLLNGRSLSPAFVSALIYSPLCRPCNGRTWTSRRCSHGSPAAARTLQLRNAEYFRQSVPKFSKKSHRGGGRCISKDRYPLGNVAPPNLGVVRASGLRFGVWGLGFGFKIQG